MQPGRFSEVLAMLRAALHKEQLLRIDAERKTIIGLHTAAGSAVAAAIAIAVDLIAHSDQLAALCIVALLPLAAKCGQLLGLRSWDRRIKQLAAAPGVINERQVARDEYQQQLEDIALMHIPDDARVRLQELAYAKHLIRLDAIEQRQQGYPQLMVRESLEHRPKLALQDDDSGYLLPEKPG